MPKEKLQTKTENLPRVVSIDDARRVVVELGISPEGEVDQTIIGWRRRSRYKNDVVATIFNIISQAAGNPEIKERFETRYQAPLNARNLCLYGLGGGLLNTKKANLPRSSEDQKRDEEATVEQERLAKEQARKRDEELQKEFGEEFEIPAFLRQGK